jgi:acyl-lipid omega-6 desaturase (Delta-12 desaturase)
MRTRERSTARGLGYFGVSVLAYLLPLVAIVLSPAWWQRLVAAVVCGLSVGVLFVVGHDACHGSLTPNGKLNAALGRISFLPSLHPYAAWEYSHNALHHGFTNLRGKDPVYCPLTLAEYRALTPFRRRIERAYRTFFGVAALYLIEIWWKHEIAPSREHALRIARRATFQRDRALVFAFPFVVILALGLLGFLRAVPVTTLVGMIVLALSVPFLVFNWLIGFATFQHHTHPRVLWFADQADWSFYRAQVLGTVHVVFPRWIAKSLHNIMDHTAHHVDTKVPLYHVTDAQEQLEQTFAGEVVREPFTFAALRRTFDTCQLYDYERHQWLDFEGRATSEPRALKRTTALHGLEQAATSTTVAS